MLLAAQAASASPPAPVAAYSFDEGTGTTLTDSARSHNGTISGATWTTSGKYGSALDFDGRDLVTITDANDLDLTRNLTLEAWVRPDTLANGTAVISKASGSIGSTAAGYLLSPSWGTPLGGVGASGTLRSVTAPAISTGTWSHLAFTSDGTNLSIYINGALARTVATGISAATTTADLKLGFNQLWSTYFDGQIDEVRIYDVTLSQSQIQADKDTAVGLDQYPVAAYSFDEGTGTTLTDSARSHNGTISGATWTTSGKYGSALDFDGLDDVIRIADANDLDLGGLGESRCRLAFLGEAGDHEGRDHRR